MSAQLGWTTITNEELKSAQRLWDQRDHGVRDELGLSAIHFLYADRFFPGTSTQMTHLRYVFFVAGAYEQMRQTEDPAALEVHLPEKERRIAVQLIAEVERTGSSPEGSGIIGWTIVGKPGRRGHPPKLLPSMSYWTALTNWKLLNDEYGVPTRTAVHSEWELYARKPRHRGEVNEVRPLFTEEIETEWKDGLAGGLKHLGKEDRPLKFLLDPWERDLLTARLKDLVRPNDEKPTLLARLAEAGHDIEKLCGAKWPWSQPIRELVGKDDKEQDALRRSRQAAFLVQICRAAYDVLVARACAERDHLPQARVLADKLEAELETLRRPNGRTFQEATALDVEAIERDETGSENERARTKSVLARLAPFLIQMQQWLPNGHRVDELQAKFQLREFAVKQNHLRVRLTEGRDLRREWFQRRMNRNIFAAPLEYRWDVVSHWLIPELVATGK